MLELDSQLYRQVVEPNSYKWPKQERRIAESLHALTVFRVVQPVPMLLAILRDYRDGSLTLRQTKWVLQRMEDFHVQFTAVTSQRTGGGTAFMYASSARQLLESSDKNEKQQVLSEFIGKLGERIPSAEEFHAGFAEIWFTDENARSRQLVRYLLRRLDTHLRERVIPDYELFTIEHLSPQNPAGKLPVSGDVIGTMGICCLWTESSTESLKNKEPSEKLKKLNAGASPSRRAGRSEELDNRHRQSKDQCSSDSVSTGNP